MTETRTVHDPFLGKDVQVSDRLLDRLRGKYAQGPTMPNGEPEFGWRQFPTPPIQREAADEIERLRTQLDIAITALRRVVSLAEKNVPKYAQEIASEGLRYPVGREQ